MYSRKRIKESCSQKRIEELDKSKIDMMLKMFYSAIYRCIKVDCVLVDSWFTCDALIHAVRGIRSQAVHLTGMYKFVKTKFEYKGNQLTHAEINNRLGKPKRCRYIAKCNNILLIFVSRKYTIRYVYFEVVNYEYVRIVLLDR
jgi:hypothetical protein